MDFLDKNALFYHRHKGECDAWKRLTNGQGGVLKMYPTFKPSDSKVVVSFLSKVLPLRSINCIREGRGSKLITCCTV